MKDSESRLVLYCKIKEARFEPFESNVEKMLSFKAVCRLDLAVSND